MQDDRANQVKNLAKLSAIIAGFSMSSFLEFNFDPSTVPTGLLIVYGITTAGVAAIYMGCMATCNLLLNAVLQVAQRYTNKEEESHFILQCREFAIRYRRGDRPPAPPRSFRRLWDFRCASSWRLTLIMFAAGVPLFLVNMAVSAWIKFAQYKPGAIFMTAIMGLGLLYLAFTITQWLTHLVWSYKSKHEVASLAVEPQGLPWDWYLEPVVYAKGMKYSQPMSNAAYRHVQVNKRRSHEQILLWREDDLEQQHLENALALWTRFVRETRTEVNERAEQLRALSFLASILLSFGMAALYQLNFTVTAYPGALNVLYALTLGLTVALNLCSLMLCGFLNMGIVKVGASLAGEEEQARFVRQCRAFAHAPAPRPRPPHPLRTFASYWSARCEWDWALASGSFTAGAAIFQSCLVFSAWLKFAPRPDPTADPPLVDHSAAAATMTVILGLGIAYFCFVSIRWARAPQKLVAEERVKWGSLPPSVGLPFDWHIPPSRWDNKIPPAEHHAPRATGQDLPFSPSPESPYAALYEGLFSEPTGMPVDMHDDLRKDEDLWAAHTQQQRHLNNALSLWKRFTDRHLQDLEERQEQLKAVTELAAVISGFEMIAFLQFQFDTTQIATGLQLAYVATSGLTVALMACSMTVCGIMLESILESSSEFVNPALEADFISQCRQFCLRYRPGDRPPAPRKSFRAHWDTKCEGEWRRAFYMFSLGIPMFLANAAVSSWIKFQGDQAPAIVLSVIQGLAVVYLTISHARWVRHLVGTRIRPSLQDASSETVPAGLPFDWHLPSRLRTASGRSFAAGSHKHKEATPEIELSESHLQQNLRRHQ